MAGSPFAYVQEWHRKLTSGGWWHSFELPDGSRIDGVCDLEGLKHRIAQFPIPQDLRGKRALDIGAWDGWFSFELERRGAEVTAIDCWDNPRLREMRERLHSRVDYRVMDVYDLSPDTVGRFDVVLFMGVLYHLKHPVLALERVCSVTTELAAVDSFVLREEHRPGEDLTRPIMEFYETEEFGGQLDNWCGPTVPCLVAMCRTAGFARAEHLSTIAHSACVAAWRHWDNAAESGSAPELLGVLHALNFGMNFQRRRDEYMVAWFRCPTEHLCIDDVRPAAGGYGVRPVHVSAAGPDTWRAAFKLPPGLDAGWHEVRVRVGESPPSNAQHIAVDVPLRTDAPPCITGLCDGTTWIPGMLDRARGAWLSIWASGLPRNADRTNVAVRIGGFAADVLFVEAAGAGDSRQVNVQVPRALVPGEYGVKLEIAGAQSAPAVLKVA